MKLRCVICGAKIEEPLDPLLNFCQDKPVCLDSTCQYAAGFVQGRSAFVSNIDQNPVSETGGEG